MGKGDRKSKRGKLWLGSFGKKRPARVKKTVTAPAAKTKKQAAKK